MNFVNFPIMHTELVDNALPTQIMFLNYGFEDKTNKTITPENLPYSNAQMREIMQDFIRIGQNFKTPSDLQFLLKSEAERFYSGSSFEIKTELNSYGQTKQLQSFEYCQRILALWYYYENIFVEMQILNEKAQNTGEQLQEILGIDKNDTLSVANSEVEELLCFDERFWKQLLLPMSFLAQKYDYILYISDTNIKNWIKNNLIYKEDIIVDFLPNAKIYIVTLKFEIINQLIGKQFFPQNEIICRMCF